MILNIISTGTGEATVTGTIIHGMTRAFVGLDRFGDFFVYIGWFYLFAYLILLVCCHCLGTNAVYINSAKCLTQFFGDSRTGGENH